MKRTILFWLAGLFILSACHDDDQTTPNEAVVQAFHTRYPTASKVEWDTKNSYLTVDFIDNQLANTAWFDQAGQWYMTETELNRLELLPAKVQAAFQAGIYAAWQTDDIDRLERQDNETIYMIEVKQGKEEYDLYYSEDGILIKAIPDDDNDDYEGFLPAPAPSAITELIDSKYPGARIIDMEQERGMTEVDIIHENRSKEVVFNSGNTWINTHYDVLKNEVETTVIEALNRSEYSTYFIDDIEKYETPAGDYYLFELEKGETEVDIRIDTAGNLTLIKTER